MQTGCGPEERHDDKDHRERIHEAAEQDQDQQHDDQNHPGIDATGRRQKNHARALINGTRGNAVDVKCRPGHAGALQITTHDTDGCGRAECEQVFVGAIDA